MGPVTELASLKRKSYIFGNLALAGSWILFVLTLGIAAMIPERFISNVSLVVGYCLISTLLWCFYFIPSWGALFQDKFSTKKAVQHTGLVLTIIVMALLLWKGSLFIPLLLIILNIALLTKRSFGKIVLAFIAGIGEFAAIFNSVLLAMLLKALLLGNWFFEGVPMRCDLVLGLCVLLAIFGLTARGKLFAACGEWKVSQVLRKPLLITVWALWIAAVVAAFAAEKVQEGKLVAIKAEAEKLYNTELSAAGMAAYYFENRPGDALFYAQLDNISDKINKAMRFRFPGGGKGKGKGFAKPSAEQMKKFAEAQKKAFAGLTNEYIILEQLLAQDLPKYPMEFTDGKLADLQEPYVRLVNRAAFALASGMRQNPAKAVDYSRAYFRLFNSLNKGSAVAIHIQGRMVKSWCSTVRKLHESKAITPEVYKELQALAHAQAAQINIDARGKELALLELIFAYDMYRANSGTTLNITGAFFKYDRTEALRSTLEYAKTGKLPRPNLLMPLAVSPTIIGLSTGSLVEAKDMLNEM